MQVRAIDVDSGAEVELAAATMGNAINAGTRQQTQHLAVHFYIPMFKEELQEHQMRLQNQVQNASKQVQNASKQNASKGPVMQFVRKYGTHVVASITYGVVGTANFHRTNTEVGVDGTPCASQFVDHAQWLGDLGSL